MRLNLITKLQWILVVGLLNSAMTACGTIPSPLTPELKNEGFQIMSDLKELSSEETKTQESELNEIADQVPSLMYANESNSYSESGQVSYLSSGLQNISSVENMGSEYGIGHFIINGYSFDALVYFLTPDLLFVIDPNAINYNSAYTLSECFNCSSN